MRHPAAAPHSTPHHASNRTFSSGAAAAGTVRQRTAGGCEEGLPETEHRVHARCALHLPGHGRESHPPLFLPQGALPEQERQIFPAFERLPIPQTQRQHGRTGRIRFRRTSNRKPSRRKSVPGNIARPLRAKKSPATSGRAFHCFPIQPIGTSMISRRTSVTAFIKNSSAAHTPIPSRHRSASPAASASPSSTKR